MPDNLTPLAVARWLRQQASKYSQMADQLERDSGLTGQAEHVLLSSGNGRFYSDEDLLSVQLCVSETSRRIAEIAQRTSVSQANIYEMVANDDTGLERNERGWVSLKSQ